MYIIPLLLFIQTILAKPFQREYILIPKDQVFYNIFNYPNLFLQNNIKHLANIGDLNIYTMNCMNNNNNNYCEYNDFNTLSNFFYIEENSVFSIKYNKQYPLNINPKPIPWHLDRIAKNHLPLDGTYPYSEPGSCHRNPEVEIETVVVDTGCDVTHPEFEGRATFLENFTEDGEDFDSNSHGTHCSGIIGSKTYGVCKDSKLFCIKVLDGQGSGSTSGVISGMSYAFNRHLEKEKINPKLRTIMSMSLGGGKSLAMNRVVEKMVTISDTFYIVVAAGNENQDVKNTSPGSAKGIFSVMAMGENDKRAYFSNYGRTASLYGTGVNIESTIPGGKTDVYSGTSMACPSVVGVLNHYLDQFPHMNMKEIKAKMIDDATKDAIKGNPVNTPNLMVYLKRNDD